MDVRRIDLTRFTCHDRLTVDLPPRGLVLVTGPNGAGKTSLLEAVAVALFGESIRGADHWPEHPAEGAGGGTGRAAKGTPLATVAAVTVRLATTGSTGAGGMGAGGAGQGHAGAQPAGRLLHCTRTTNVYPRGPEGVSAVRHTLAWHEAPEVLDAPPSSTGALSTAPATPPAPPVWENATKAAEALRERTGPFDRWVRTHVFLARDGARFASATDTERKRILETVLGLGVFDTALKACRAEAREVAMRVAAHDGRVAGLQSALDRALASHATATAAVPAAVPPAERDAVRCEGDRVRAAIAALEAQQGPAWEALGKAREGARAAADRVTELRCAIAAAQPLGPRVDGAHTGGAKASVGALPTLPTPGPARAPTPAPQAPAVCPTCRRPLTTGAAPHAPAVAPPAAPPAAPHALPVPGTPDAAAPAAPAALPAPTPHAVEAVDADTLAALNAALTEALAAEADAHGVEVAALAALTQVQHTLRETVAEGRAIDARAQNYAAQEAARARALERVEALARECDALRRDIAEVLALGVEDREMAATLAATDTVLGFGGVRTRILAHALPFLGHRASVWLARLGRTGWAVRFDAARKGGVRGAAGEEAIAMRLDGPAKADYAALSGGEAKRVDLALLLALGELARAVHGGAAGTLWFDEVLDAPLDAEGAEAAADALAVLARDRAVVVVAHSPAVLRALRPVLHIDLGGGAPAPTA